MLYFNKILPFLLSPLFIAFMLFLVTRKRRFFWQTLPWVVLFIVAMPKTSDFLMFQLESRYPALDATALEGADMIVVLGGSLRHVEPSGPKPSQLEWASESDRFEKGLELYFAGVAPRIVFSHTGTPWSTGPSEGPFLKQKAIERGIPDEAILLTTRVENTKDEARAIKELMQEGQHIVLVTSAYHMARSVLVFEQEGISLTPVPTDFRTMDHKTTLIDFIPATRSLDATAVVMRERLGLLIYKMLYVLKANS